MWSPSNLKPELAEQLNIVSGIKPAEYVNVQPSEDTSAHLPAYRDRILIYSIHGGDVIPEAFYNAVKENYPKHKNFDKILYQTYCVEKDWGANQVAAGLASHLGLTGFVRVNIARALLDFGRLPGITPPEAGHLDRYAINYPFSSYLDIDGKRALLEQCFDPISETIETFVQGKTLVIGIHTYDHLNPTLHYTDPGTVRPELSLIFRTESFQRLKKLPSGQVDPLYPAALAESTADRRLTARISLMMERAGIAVTHNYPYFLPDGSLEVRSQVWDFFQFLRQSFEGLYPESASDPAYEAVWAMLLDTNLRNSTSEAFRSYLHMFRKAPKGRKVLFRKAQRAYDHVRTYFIETKVEIMDLYRKAPNRQSALAVEVRKDLVWVFNDHRTADPVMGPDGALLDNANHIARLMSKAIDSYFREDRREGAHVELEDNSLVEVQGQPGC